MKYKTTMLMLVYKAQKCGLNFLLCFLDKIKNRMQSMNIGLKIFRIQYSLEIQPRQIPVVLITNYLITHFGMRYRTKVGFLLLSILIFSSCQPNSGPSLQSPILLSNTSSISSPKISQSEVTTSSQDNSTIQRSNLLNNTKQRPVAHVSEAVNSTQTNINKIETSNPINTTNQIDPKTNLTKIEVAPSISNDNSLNQNSTIEVMTNKIGSASPSTDSDVNPNKAEKVEIITCSRGIPLKSTLATASRMAINAKSAQPQQFGSSSKLPSPAPIRLTYQAYKVLFQKASSHPSSSVLRSSLPLGRSSSNRSLQSSIILPSSIQKNTYRELIFIKNVNLINQHNSRSNRKFNMGLNQFTDIDQKQFLQRYATLYRPSRKYNISFNQNIKTDSNLRRRLLQKSGIQPYTTPHNNISIDWRCYSKQMRYQGECGSDYAIAPLHAIEISLRIQKNLYAIPSLSLQQIISCARSEQLGCLGGYFEIAFQYIRTIGVGLKYLYDDHSNTLIGKPPKCDQDLISKQSYKQTKTYIKSKKQIEKGDCKSMVQILKTRALAVGIAGIGLQFYKEGTYTISNPQEQVVDHGVTLVGYDPIKGYLIKNSWGKNWGIEGYGYASAKTGVCNYAEYAEI